MKLLAVVFSMCLFGLLHLEAAPIPVSGSGQNFFDNSDDVHGGNLSFSGTDGVNTISVSVLGGCTFVGSFGSNGSGCLIVFGSYNSVSAPLGTVSYNIFGGTVTLGALVVPIQGFFKAGPIIIDFVYPRGQTSGHQDLLVTPVEPVPEPSSAVMLMMACVAFGGYRASRRKTTGSGSIRAW